MTEVTELAGANPANGLTADFCAGWMSACGALIEGLTEMRTQAVGPLDPNEWFLKLRELMTSTAQRPERVGRIVIPIEGDGESLLSTPLVTDLNTAKLLMVVGAGGGMEIRAAGMEPFQIMATVANFIFMFAQKNDLEVPLVIALKNGIEQLVAKSYLEHMQQDGGCGCKHGHDEPGETDTFPAGAYL